MIYLHTTLNWTLRKMGWPLELSMLLRLCALHPFFHYCRRSQGFFWDGGRFSSPRGLRVDSAWLGTFVSWVWNCSHMHISFQATNSGTFQVLSEPRAGLSPQLEGIRTYTELWRVGLWPVVAHHQSWVFKQNPMNTSVVYQQMLSNLRPIGNNQPLAMVEGSHHMPPKMEPLGPLWNSRNQHDDPFITKAQIFGTSKCPVVWRFGSWFDPRSPWSDEITARMLHEKRQMICDLRHFQFAQVECGNFLVVSFSFSFLFFRRKLVFIRIFWFIAG